MTKKTKKTSTPKEQIKRNTSVKSTKKGETGNRRSEAKIKLTTRVATSAQKGKRKGQLGDAMKHSPPERDFLDTVDLDHSLEEDCQEPDFRALGLEIAEKAYQLYEERGGEPGQDVDDWLEAERQVLFEERQTLMEKEPD